MPRTSSERLEFRIQAAKKAKIARAAALLHLHVGDFARSAAEEKADAVIREHEATTTVPAEFFDQMLAALDTPAAPAPALVEAMRRADATVTRA